jgi:hypothetical protein
VASWFQKRAFKFNLCRYIEDEVVIYDEREGDGTKRKYMVAQVPDGGERAAHGLLTPARTVVLPTLVPPPPPPVPDDGVTSPAPDPATAPDADASSASSPAPDGLLDAIDSILESDAVAPAAGLSAAP